MSPSVLLTFYTVLHKRKDLYHSSRIHLKSLMDLLSEKVTFTLFLYHVKKCPDIFDQSL